MAAGFWQVPALVHACTIARVADVDIEELEEALEAREQPSPFLLNLHSTLLRGLDAAELERLGWEDALRSEHVRRTGNAGPLKKKKYRDLNLGERIGLLHSLCEWRAMDAEGTEDPLQGGHADSLRVEPLGRDRHGSTYWHFSGLRLYKEARAAGMDDSQVDSSQHRAGIWSLVCTTPEDWIAFAATLNSRGSGHEATLCARLQREHLPRVSKLMAKEARDRKRAALAQLPRRTSKRLARSDAADVDATSQHAASALTAATTAAVLDQSDEREASSPSTERGQH